MDKSNLNRWIGATICAAIILVAIVFGIHHHRTQLVQYTKMQYQCAHIPNQPRQHVVHVDHIGDLILNPTCRNAMSSLIFNVGNTDVYVHMHRTDKHKIYD